ncbi:hypothetical protein Lepto7376_2409 [[Leptolyngbya] sp. PCC 7376]|uniref:COP23 domain-containing protein n=1 Tax=[Leptolyngbya] sp. PCC 7376 TaxID=111781 RepID=UPI00029F0FDD|nr:COP23 domain-containing protein [[Leptolyngbya] sp. PCC 7376]AFY38689.1 hypothetical protein Lepto7376_2409 [[Leptolyngbya] sp. PCC 7376]
MTKSDVPEPYRLLLFGAAAIASLTIVLIWGVSWKTGRNVLKSRQFSCEKLSEPQSSELLWTVVFQNGGEEKPWLRMISGLEGDVTPEQRCEEIAHTLDVNFADQLQALFYRPNPATPNRHAVCVQTAAHGDSDCANLVILKENIEPQRFFERFTVDLQEFAKQPSSTQQTQSNGAIATFSTGEEQPPQGLSRIDLKPFLEADAPAQKSSQ